MVKALGRLTVFLNLGKLEGNFFIFELEMEEQRCEHENCLLTHNVSSYVVQKNEECYICKGPLNEFGILKNCDHIFCANCLKEVRKQSKSIKCPQCKLTSFTAVYASCIFRNEEKELLFRDHIKCLFGGDPAITRYLDDLNSEWLTAVETTASSEGHGLFRATLYAEGYSKTLGAELLHISSNHAKFRLRDGSVRVVVFCLMPDCLCLRIVLGSDPLFGFEHEDEYADEAVGYFNRQLGASWEAIPYIFRDGAETCILSRKFGETRCALKFRLLKFCPFKRLWKDVPEGMPVPMKEQLANIRLQNFKFTWRDIERMIEGKFNFAEEVESNVFPLLHDQHLC